MTVRFSTRAPNADYLGFVASPEAIIAAAKKAEAVGFDAIFVNDHIIVGDDARSAPRTNVYDPFVSMSFIAAHTTRHCQLSGQRAPFFAPLGLRAGSQIGEQRSSPTRA